MFFIIAVFLYVTLVGYEHKIRRLHGTLQLLAEFHKTHIQVHKCESWENYIDDLRSEEKKSTRLQNLKFYIDYCERIGSTLPELKTPISEHNICIPNDTIYVCCSENGKSVGIQENVTKNTWTRYTYDEHTDKVKYIDRYHTIPALGTGTLSANFYRTVTIYDLRGREVAVAQYISEGRWMVDAKKLDWRGRIIETLRGEAMNPPTFADLNNPSFLHTLTKTIYDGNRIDRCACPIN
jgi:hypothetical protein